MLAVTLGLLFFSLVAFLIIGSLNAGAMKTREDMFSAAARLDRFQIARTTLAANVSISGGIQWFLVQGSTAGLAIIIWGPIAVLIGMYLNAMFVDRYAPAAFFEKYSSFATLTRDLFGGRLASWVVLGITSLGSLTILLVEIYVGVAALQIFFPQVSAAGLGATGVVVGAVTIYALMGGLLGIVRNDWIQNALVMSVGIVVVLVFFGGGKPVAAGAEAFRPEFAPIPLELIVWLVIVNMFFIPTQLRFWQVAGSAANREAFVRGYKRAAVQTTLLWAMLAIVGYALLHYLGQPFSTLDGLLRVLVERQGDMVINVSFGLITIAAFAALVSTADSAIISLAQCASDVIAPKSTGAWLQRVIIGAVGVVTLGLYAGIFGLLGTRFIDVFSSAFSLFILIAPMVCLAMIRPDIGRSKVFQSTSLVGLLVAVLVVLLSTYTSLPNLPSPLWSGSIGFGISLLSSVAGFLVVKIGQGAFHA